MTTQEQEVVANVDETVKEPKVAKAIVKKKVKKVKKGTKAKKVMAKKVKKNKSAKEKSSKTGGNTKFRYWLMENNITQKDLATRTHLSVNTVYRLTKFGTGTKSIIKLVAMELNLSEDKLTKMLKQ